jgi:hypothetical protein
MDGRLLFAFRKHEKKYLASKRILMLLNNWTAENVRLRIRAYSDGTPTAVALRCL